MAIHYHLKFDGIKGESQRDKHKGEIEIKSWNWAAQNLVSRTGGGLSGGTGIPTEVTFTKEIDTASPKLLEMCNNGKHIANAVLTCSKSVGDKNPVDYLTLKFEEIAISSYQTGGAQGEDVGHESISFAFNKIDYDYKIQNKDGTLSSAGNTKGDYGAATFG